MRLGTVIGRVTMTQQEPVFRGSRLLLVQPLNRAQYAELSGKKLTSSTAKLTKTSALVAYDQLGADIGHIVGFTEGAEATAPFTMDAPVDAYIACIVDQIEYHPPEQKTEGLKG